VCRCLFPKQIPDNAIAVTNYYDLSHYARRSTQIVLACSGGDIYGSVLKYLTKNPYTLAFEAKT